MNFRRRINRFDVFIAMTLLLIFGAILLSQVRKNDATPSTEALITVKIEGVLPEIADALLAEQSFSVDGYYALDAIGHTSENARLRLRGPNGDERLAPSLSRIDLTLTLHAFGSYSEVGFLLEGKRPLYSNMGVTLSGRDTVAVGRINGIEEIKTQKNP